MATKTTKNLKPTKIAKTAKPKKETEVAAKVSGLTVSVMGVDGKKKGTMTLPGEVFGEKINKPLMAQAVRVYLANQRQGGAHTKTRGQVQGSTRKIYKQKGTGKARHGSIRAHIFVGGGVVFGPVTHDFTLVMPAKMKRKALVSALTSQLQDGNVIVVDGLADLKPKTKFMATALASVVADTRLLLVLAKDSEIVARTARNIEGVDTMPVSNLTTYDVLTHQKIVFMKDAIKQVTV